MSRARQSAAAPSAGSVGADGKLQVAILAGGLGTRLRPITEKIPKPLVPVAGRPFLHWQLLDLKRQGYTRVLLLVAYLGEQIEAHFGSGRELGLEISYAYEREPLGTGGALVNAIGQLDSEFILLNGDSFLRAPLDEMVASFRAAQANAMISVYKHSELSPVIPNLKVTRGSGAAASAGSGAAATTVFAAEHARHHAFERVAAYEKDAGVAKGFDCIDSGVYIVRRALLKANEPPRAFALADLWPPLIATESLAAFEVAERFWDIGTPDRLREFEEIIHDYFANAVSN